MSDKRDAHRSTVLGYVVYGLATCLVLLMPWIGLEELFKRVPAASGARDRLRELELPFLLEGAVVLGILVVALAAVGWFVRRYLWEWLASAPIFGRFMPSVEKFADQIREGGGKRRDLVAWVPWSNDRMSALGIVKGHVPAPTGDGHWLVVVIYPTAGQIKSGNLRIVSPDSVVYPGWTIDEAFAFIASAGGTSRQFAGPATED